MEPAMWTDFLHPLPPEERIELLGGKGWRFAEICSSDSRTVLERGDPGTAGAEYAAFARDHGVAVTQGHLWLTCDIVSSRGESIVAELKRWLDLYLAIGVRAAVLHPGGGEMKEQGAEPERILDAQARALRELGGHLAGTDLFVCLENMTGHQAHDLVAIIDAAGRDNLGICLDTGHLNLIPGDQALFIRTAGPLLKATHITDNDTTHDQHLMPYARGTVDWPAVVGALREIGYAGLFNFEIPGENRCPIPVRLAKLDYLKAILPTLLQP